MRMTRALTLFSLFLLLTAVSAAQTEPGRHISLGQFSILLNCSGRGGPTVVVESGLGDFSFDWLLVQQRVQPRQRVCTYDRAGYGSSDAGPVPRMFAQLNLELHEALRRAGERPPFVLVGHSFGGAVVRNYAATYPGEVAGVVLAESVTEHQPLVLGNRPTLLKEFATGKPVPEPSLDRAIARPDRSSCTAEGDPESRLPQWVAALHRRFDCVPTLEATEASEREWSAEYYAAWDRHPQAGLLGTKPLVVITRAELGQAPTEAFSVEAVDGQRLRAQTELLGLSKNSMQIIVRSGHNLHTEVPDVVAWAIQAASRSWKTGTALAAAQ